MANATATVEDMDKADVEQLREEMEKKAPDGGPSPFDAMGNGNTTEFTGGDGGA